MWSSADVTGLCGSTMYLESLVEPHGSGVDAPAQERERAANVSRHKMKTQNGLSAGCGQCVRQHGRGPGAKASLAVAAKAFDG